MLGTALLRRMAILAAVGGSLVVAACGGGASGKPHALTPTLQTPNGYLAFVTGAPGESDRGKLSLVSLSDHSTRVIAASISRHDALTYATAIGSLVAVRYSSGPPEIVSYNLQSGDAKKVDDGRGPSVYGTDVAYCTKGRLVITNLQTRTQTVVAEVGASTSCVPLAWSHDGQLAFVAHTPPAGARPASVRLMIRGLNGDLRDISIAEAQFGATALSWSYNDRSIAISADHRQIILKDVATAASTSVLTGDLARYAPATNKLAVLDYATTEAEASIAIYDDLRQTATRRLGHLSGVGFDWIPGDGALALALDDSLAIWSLSDDMIDKISVPGALFPGTSFSNIRFVPTR